jgi:hypothetical protein
MKLKRLIAGTAIAASLGRPPWASVPDLQTRNRLQDTGRTGCSRGGATSGGRTATPTTALCVIIVPSSTTAGG